MTMPGSHMKWWGWGEDGIAFSHDDKPAFAPFVKKHLGVDLNKKSKASRVDFESLQLSEPKISVGFRQSLENIVGAEFVSHDPMQRVLHSRGKSLRDIVLTRQGRFGRLPDIVVYPANENEVIALTQAAIET